MRFAPSNVLITPKLVDFGRFEILLILAIFLTCPKNRIFGPFLTKYTMCFNMAQNRAKSLSDDVEGCKMVLKRPRSPLVSLKRLHSVFTAMALQI